MFEYIEVTILSAAVLMGRVDDQFKRSRPLRLEILSPLVKVELPVLVNVSRLESFLDVNDLVSLQIQFVQHLVVALG